MFNCQVTGKTSQAGEKPIRLVVKTRDWAYTDRRQDPDTGLWEEVVIGRGFEIVRELKVTEEGQVEWDNMNSAQREEHLKHV